MYDLDIAFAVIEERKPGIDFLQNEFFLAAVEVHQSQGILQSAETGFFGLYESSYKVFYTNPALIRTFVS